MSTTSGQDQQIGDGDGDVQVGNGNGNGNGNGDGHTLARIVTAVEVGAESIDLNQQSHETPGSSSRAPSAAAGIPAGFRFPD